VPRTQILHVEPDVLRWARTSAGVPLADAARSLGIEPELLATWEGEHATPTARQLEHLADRYKRPVVFLLMDRRPDEPALPPDFRRNVRRTDSGLGEEARLAIRRARRLQGISRDLRHAKRLRPAVAVLRDDAESAARQMRQRLRIDVNTQLDWRDARVALRAWRTALEDAGVLVLRFSMPTSELRAFSLAGTPPVIVVTSRDGPAAQSFSLMHEWCHLLLGQAAMCRPNESSRRLRGDDEVFCNAFAGALLVPMDELLVHPIVTKLSAGDVEIDDAAIALSRAFSVSRFVTLRRLLKAALVTSDDYSRLTSAWLGQPAPKRGGFAHPAVKAVSELGRPLVRAIAAARQHGEISELDAANYLNVSAAHLGRIDDLVGV
jgi:Zn-dependent peptidase ImmA (M78 family)/transcriptional regulator with XRE-family HTH domain